MQDSTSADVKPAPSLRRNFGWTFTGNAVYAASRWLTFAVLAKLVSPAEVGRYALAVAVVAPAFALASMNLRSIQATDARAETRFHDFAAMRVITIVGAYAICVAMTILSRHLAAFRSVILIAALIQAVDWLSDLIFGLFDQRERFNLGGTSQAVRGVLRLLGLGVVLRLTHELELAMIAELVINASVFLAYDCVIGARILRDRSHTTGVSDGLAPRWHPPALKNLLKLSLPMAGLLLIASTQVNLPRYFVDHFEGSHDLGLIAALGVLALAPTPIVTALSQAMLPRLGRYWASRDRRAFFRLIRTSIVVVFALGAVSVIGALVLGEPVVRMLYTADYAARNDLFVSLVVAAVFVTAANVYGVGITATRDYRAPLISQIVAMGLALPIYLALTLHYGTIGASWALVFHSLLTLAGYVFILHTRELD